jgi:hypothetical protein
VAQCTASWRIFTTTYGKISYSATPATSSLALLVHVCESVELPGEACSVLCIHGLSTACFLRRRSDLASHLQEGFRIDMNSLPYFRRGCLIVPPFLDKFK